MKLLDDFFSIVTYSLLGEGFTTTIKFNPEHIIYAGHFPGYPVTPGVIQVQIVHELLENQLGGKLKLISIPQCKFVKVLNPNETPEIDIHLKYKWANDVLDIHCYGQNGPDLFFKLTATYQR